ncbi:MAG: HEPN domain-containing protein [Candidatus Rokubacteria bacterium]|nr:HEPN domain-containing protein [Candidatus Rokubacteria bacterium]
MKPDPKAEGSRWLRQAEHDLSDAEYSSAGSRYSLACFLCQPAAGKALKAFPYARGAEQVLGHSVADLAEECGKLAEDFRALRARAAPLDHYYVPTRYPNSLPRGIPAEAFDASDARRALALAGDVIRLVKAKLAATARPSFGPVCRSRRSPVRGSASASLDDMIRPGAGSRSPEPAV